MDVIPATLGVLSPTERAIQTLETAWINAVRRSAHLEKMKKDDPAMKNIPRSEVTYVLTRGLEPKPLSGDSTQTRFCVRGECFCFMSVDHINTSHSDQASE